MTELPPARSFTLDFDSRTKKPVPTTPAFQFLNALLKPRAIVDGGTGATTASDARDNLGLGTGDDPTFNSITVTNDADIGGDANVTGDVGGATLTIAGAGTVGGTLGVTGGVSGTTGTFSSALSGATVTSSGLIQLANRIKVSSQSIASNSFHLFDFGEDIFGGVLIVASNNLGINLELYWMRAASTPGLVPKFSNAQYQNTTGALTGTTGAVGVTTVSVDTLGRVWVENREAVSLTYYVIAAGG